MRRQPKTRALPQRKPVEGEWIDDGHSRGRTFTMRLGWMEVTVTRHVDFPDDAWVLRTLPPFLDLSPLESKDLEHAKHEAMTVVHRVLGDARDRVGRALMGRS